MTVPTEPRAAARLFFDLLGSFVEVRAFLPSSGRAQTWSGYYGDGDELARAVIETTDRGATGVFATVNPPVPALRARGLNRLARASRGGTTSDDKIERRVFLVLDLDPVRPSGISATDAEKEEGKERGRAVVAYLRSRGWPEPVVVDSGNGVHLYYPVDLPTDDGGLVARILQALDARFSDGAVHVDTTVGNASRIMKVPGTWARKGEDTLDRPHRRAAFLSLPDWTDGGKRPDVSRRQLEDLAALAPTNAKADMGADSETVRSALETVAALGRLSYPDWSRLSASVLAACGDDASAAERLLVETVGEEKPGEYRTVLASRSGEIGPGTLFYMARDAGWTRPKQTRREHGRAERPRDRRRAESIEPGAVPLGVCVADVEAEAVRWMWEPWLASGKIHNLDGDPGTGKSTLYAYLAACFTAGVPWPDGSPVPAEARGGVVVVTAEDDVATTIKPRMEAAGADVSRVSVVSLVPTPNGHGRMPVLPDDIDLLIGECERIGARLLVVDPVTAYLGDVNSHRDSDVRGALAPLAEAAERAGVAVLLIRHLNKGTGSSALYRSGGSIAFSGLARVVLLAARVPDDPDRRGLAVTKNNLAAFPQTLGYHLESAGPFNVGRAAWHGPISLTADDLVRPPAAQASTPAQDDAADFLTNTLATGPRLAREVYAEAEAAGITERTLKRAKARLGIEAERRGGPGGSGAWYWIGPEPKGAKDPASGPLGDVSGDGAAGISPEGLGKPKGATPMAPLDGVASLADRGPLSAADEISTGGTVRTPRGLGTVNADPSGGEVSVEVDGLPLVFPLSAVAPVPTLP